MKQKVMKTLAFNLIILGIALIAVTGCKKDNTSTDEGEVLFSYVANNYHVDFTNESTATGSISWDFGDGSTSTEENPSHDYASKGTYHVTLTVGSKSTFTNITIDKSSEIVLDDDSFDDWNNINSAYTIPTADLVDGVVKDFKYDYDAAHIYFYFKVEGTPDVNFQILDMLIDIDPDQVTGYQYDLWPAFGGGEILIENSFAVNGDQHPDYYIVFANYDPNGTDWESTWIYDDTIDDAQVIGTYHATGDVAEIEFAISRTKIASLQGADKVKIVGWVSDSDWTEVGWIPGRMPNNPTAQTPQADGIIIDMQ